VIVFDIPLRVPFRGVRRRQGILFQGEAGWAEWSPFREYADEEAAERLAVRLVLPLGACHLPAFVILGIAPVVASVGMSMLTG